MIDDKKLNEMMQLEGKKKDPQAQEKFNEWYSSLNDAEKAEFEAYKKKQLKLGWALPLFPLGKALRPCHLPPKN